MEFDYVLTESAAPMAKTKKPAIQKPSKGRIVTVINGGIEYIGLVYNVQENGLLGVKCISESGRESAVNNIPHKSEAASTRLYWDWPKRA